MNLLGLIGFQWKSYIGKTWGLLGLRRLEQLEAIEFHMFVYDLSLCENMLE